MSPPGADYLYGLLPAFYRQLDAGRGSPLRALMSVLGSQYEAIENNIGGLYENEFIETCDDWVVPYIAELVDVRGLGEDIGLFGIQRALVGNTIAYRRRKGVATVLQPLVWGATGWYARAAELPESLSATPSAGRGDGPPELPTVTLFVFRLGAYPIDRGTPYPVSTDGLYRFNPLDYDVALYNQPFRAPPLTRAATDTDLPVAISRDALALDLADYLHRYGALPASDRPPNSRYYGPNRSMCVIADGQPLPPDKITAGDLSAWQRPEAGLVAIDPELGRLTFAVGGEPAKSIAVSYNYAFSAPLGGGPYERRARLSDPTSFDWIGTVGPSGEFPSIDAALAAWAQQGPARGLVQIVDSGNYTLTTSSLAPPADALLVLAAADQERPSLCLSPSFTVTAPAGGLAALSLSGLLVQGAIALSGTGALQIELVDCSLIPARKADESSYPDPDVLVADATLAGLKVSLRHSIAGALRLAGAAPCELRIADSIVDSFGSAFAIAADDAGQAPGPPCFIERSTIFGQVFVTELRLASDVLFMGRVELTSGTGDCLRYSYLPPDSSPAPGFRCQPRMALAEAAAELGLPSIDDLPPEVRDRVLKEVTPSFTSLHYPDPGYAQLSLSSSALIRTGASNGAEMGAFNFLRQPQRAEMLERLAREYLPLGCQADIRYVT